MSDQTPGVAASTEARPDWAATRPDGPFSAALIAGGIGILTLGIFTTLAEANETFKGKLSLNDDVGPLSGKTIWTVIIWLIAWGVVGYLLRGRDQMLRTALLAFVVLAALGFLGTFPTFFQAFAPD